MKTHPCQDAFNKGFEAQDNARNPYLHSSNNFEAFDLGRYCRVNLSYDLVRPSRGSAWRSANYLFAFHYERNGKFWITHKYDRA